MDIAVREELSSNLHGKNIQKKFKEWKPKPEVRVLFFFFKKNWAQTRNPRTSNFFIYKEWKPEPGVLFLKNRSTLVWGQHLVSAQHGFWGQATERASQKSERKCCGRRQSTSQNARNRHSFPAQSSWRLSSVVVLGKQAELWFAASSSSSGDNKLLCNSHAKR